MRISFCGMVLLGLWASTVSASAAYDCRSIAEHRQFDFWLGTWTVTANGQPAGRNTITADDHGCLVREAWRSVNGGVGHSLNYFDPEARQWHQLWVSDGVTIDIRGGLDEAGAMALEGHIYGYVAGQRVPFRGRWSLNEDGSVRQLFEQQNEDGEWAVWFDGRYVRDTDPPD